MRPIREFTDSFVDDVAVHSDQWKEHMNDLDNFLRTIKEAGITLNLKSVNGRKVRSNFAVKLSDLEGGLRTQKRSKSSRR